MSLRLAAAREDFDPSVETAHECNGWELYRDHTTALLRKYYRMSLDLGRVPSLLGGELFRARVTAYTVHSFEDVVIFVHDVERCLEKLDSNSKKLIALVVLQDYSHDEAADELGLCRRQVVRSMNIAMDRTAELLLQSGLMEPLHGQDGLPPKKGPVRVRNH